LHCNLKYNTTNEIACKFPRGFGIVGWIMYVCSEAVKEDPKMRRRILLVDDEVAVLLTLKAVLEISGFDVDTAASAREGVSKLHTREYHMLITDMRMEHDVAGVEVIKAARSATYHPAVALLTAFPVAEEDWQEMGADQLLVKPMHTRILLQQIEDLIASHERKLAQLGAVPAAIATQPAAVKKAPANKAAAKKPAAKKAVAKKLPAKKLPAPTTKNAPTKNTTAKRLAKAAGKAKQTVKKAAKSKRKS
jgi:DNA-binding response OmpR family regulator